MAKKKEELFKQVEETDAAEQEKPAKDVEEPQDHFQSEEEEMEGNGEEQIFEHGPTKNQVQDWKSRFDGEVYVSDFGKHTFIWRPIRRNEYKRIQSASGNPDEFWIEEAICRECILWPEGYANHKMAFGNAGVPSTLSQMVMEKSGFLRPQTFKL